MDAKLAKIYYSPQGYWKGIAAVIKLANAAKVSPETAKQWLVKQTLRQVYLPPPRHIPRPTFVVSSEYSTPSGPSFFAPRHPGPRARAQDIQICFDGC